MAGKGGIGAVRAEHEGLFGQPGRELGHHLCRQLGHRRAVLSVKAHVDRDGDLHPAPRRANANGEHDEVEPACVDDLGARRSHRVAPRGRTLDVATRAVEQRVVEVAHEPAGPVAHRLGDDE